MEIIAQRGLGCGLLVPWQAAVLRAQSLEPLKRFDPEMRGRIAAEVGSGVESTPCDAPMVAGWIESTRDGVEAEMLPPYLIVYREMASAENPPAVFAATALRLDYTVAIDAINAKLEALEASGATPEGGKPWSDYIARTSEAAATIARALRGEDEDGKYSPDEAAALVAQSALITELWLQEPASRQ